MSNLYDLQAAIRKFRDARNWDQFHDLKSLVMALHCEAGELADLFLWHRSPERHRVEEEIGDIMIYLLEICDKLNIDPLSCASAKMATSEIKYPAEKASGNCLKYSELK